MPQAPGAQEPEKSADDQIDSVRMKRIRLRQLRTDARARATEAQDVMVRAIERNALYSLWLVIAAALCALITAAAVGFVIWSNLSQTPS